MDTEAKTNTTLSAMDVARHVIAAFYGKGKEVDERVSEGISNLKLQKLLYFCQAFSLAKLDRPMFKEELSAWKYGPVVSEVYEKYKEHENNPLPEPELQEGATNLSDEDKVVVREVLEIFGGYSAIRLMETTHSHKPWKDLEKRVEKGERDIVIPQEAMKKYYKPMLSVEEEYGSN